MKMEPLTSDTDANATHHYHTTVGIMIWYYVNGVAGSIIALLGVAGNVVSALVLLHPSMRNSTSVLLVVMAAYDTVFLLLHILLQGLPLIFFTHLIADDFIVVREFLFKYFYVVIHTAHTGTIYMTLTVTLERAMVVLLPLRAKLICTKLRAGIASLVVTVWSILYNAPRWFEFTRDSNCTVAVTQFSVTRSDFGRSYLFEVVYLVYWNSVFHLLLPVGVIAYLNARMIQRVCTRGRRVQPHGTCDQQTRLTIMIIVLTVIFCACQLFAALELILYPNAPVGGAEEDDTCTLACYVIGALAETCTLLNSATNFLVYSIFGKKFRHCLRHVCCAVCRTGRRGTLSSSSSSSSSKRLRETTTRQTRKSSLIRLASDDSRRESGLGQANTTTPDQDI